ncbi:MAG: hypothetical protein IPK56_11505 [Elusimicrobia bacterium]|nr:hypothetical protein [Elusimicrobiota bacterium]
MPHDAIRFYQAQADIVVDQLLVPGGGQTGREGLALGKPVLTRLHPAQRKAFAAAARPEDPPPTCMSTRATSKNACACWRRGRICAGGWASAGRNSPNGC